MLLPGLVGSAAITFYTMAEYKNRWMEENNWGPGSTQYERWFPDDPPVTKSAVDSTDKDRSSLLLEGLEGHIFSEDGYYQGHFGSSEENGCFVVSRPDLDKLSDTKIEERQKLQRSIVDLDKTKITGDTMLKYASIVYSEASQNLENGKVALHVPFEQGAGASAKRNFLVGRARFFPDDDNTFRRLASKAPPFKSYAFGSNNAFKDLNKVVNHPVGTTALTAAFNAISGKTNASLGATHWDGVDLACKGLSHIKPRTAGVEIKPEHLTLFEDYWRQWEADNNGIHFQGKSYTFSPSLVSGIHPAVAGAHAGKVLFVSIIAIGGTIFWGPNVENSLNEKVRWRDYYYG